MHRTKRVPTLSGAYSSLLLLSSALSRPASGRFIFDGVSVPDVLGKRNVTRTYDPANPVETCHDSLSAADADGDGVVQNDEYVSFVADLSEGDFDVANYVDLPFVLKVNFVFLMCLCGTRPEHNAAGNGCCEGPEGGIYAPGAVPTGPGGINLDWEEEYLNTVCEETQGAIELARDEMPTGSPVKVPTDLPSLSPLERPTQSPTVGPTDQPSISPSKRPTALPSAGPTTSVPTAGPTVAPSTAEPTGGPTAKPVTAGPTTQPTDEPTPRPTTRTPSLSPNTAPTTEVPTEAPTTSPPTVQPTLGPNTPPPSPEPSAQPSTGAPVVGTEAPTVVPAATSNVPTHVPPTLAPIFGTVAPAFSPISEMPTLASGSKAPISRTGAPTAAPVSTAGPPTPVQEPTAPAPVIDPSAAPTKAPISKDTQYPSVSSRPSRDRTIPPWYTPEPPSFPTSPIPPASTTPEVQKPGEGGDKEGGEGEEESLSAGQIAGICIASAVVVYAAVYIYAKRRKRENEDPELQDIPNKDLDDLEAGCAASPVPLDDDENVAAGAQMGGGDGGAGAAVAAPPVCSSEDSDTAIYEGEPYDKAGYIPTSARAVGGEDPPRSPSSERLLITGVPPSPTGRATAKGSDSSSAGESGWSSSAGVSSLNTASFDAGTDDGLLPGSPDRLLAAIGAASAATATADSVQRDARPTFLTIKGSGSGDGSHASSTISGGRMGVDPVLIHSQASSSASPRAGRVTREDLNAAIEAGDWAMVGATAALLADGASGSDLSLSESDAGIRSTESGVSSRSFASRESESYVSESSGSARARARELDRMVEKGDWEGVVLAAAQFEGSGRSNEEETEFSSASGRTESSEKMREMRAEVERLVRRVVPDEIDNVDEMMLQFEGRTEELIETLRTMQERSVAQRARAAVQKQARARASISGDSGLALPAQPRRRSLARSSSGSSSAELEFYGNDSSVSDYDYANASPRSMSSSVSDLGMTGSDTNTSSSRRSNQSSLELAIEKGDWRAVGEAAAMMGEGSAIIPDDGDGSASHSSSSGPPESLGRLERAHYLDALIARGDWAGIVAAAGRYQAMDDRGLRGAPPTEEEREALAQADMWRTIAEQSGKDAGDGSGAAAEAADWAISRSLERRMRGEGDGTDIMAGEFAAKRAKVVDDESV